MRRAVLCIWLCAPAWAGCGSDGSGREYRPAAAVPRLVTDGADVAEIGQVLDFDVHGDRLYLLERQGRVVILHGSADGWQLESAFERHGGGPGEFIMASGIAAAADVLIVTEQQRIHLLTPDGHPVRTDALRLPCAVARPQVAAGRHGVFIHGNCIRRALVTDTMKAVLLWSPEVGGATDMRVVAEEARFTRDGRVGTIFGAPSAFTPDASGVHLFGTGTTNCIWRVFEDGGAELPRAVRQCPAAAELYTAEPPPELEQRLRAGVPGITVRWPKPLPAYYDRIRVSGEVVLVRAISADSLLLQTSDVLPRDLLVAPFDSFVGCRAGGCLWVETGFRGARLLLLTPLELAGLLARDDES